jgi:hypothetical protein
MLKHKKTPPLFFNKTNILINLEKQEKNKFENYFFFLKKKKTETNFFFKMGCKNGVAKPSRICHEFDRGFCMELFCIDSIDRIVIDYQTLCTRFLDLC